MPVTPIVGKFAQVIVVRPWSFIPKVAIWAAVGVPVFGNHSGGIAAASAIVDPTWATNSSPSPACTACTPFSAASSAVR